MPAGAVDVDAPLSGLGVDSVAAAGLAERLGNWLGRPLSPTVFWDHPTLAELATALSGAALAPARADAPGPGGYAPVAVVGMACRFPGASSPEHLWNLIRNGGDASVPVAARRWPELPDDEIACLLENVTGFDAAFFGISNLEADEMDPQQRLLLEVAWESLENAGIQPGTLRESRTGVFVGISSFDHQSAAGPRRSARVYTVAGMAHSIAANRISYVLGLRGPSVAVDTACSSSLVAVHLAARSLQLHECDLSIVAGVNVIFDPAIQHAFRGAGMLSPGGRSRPFDDGADGYCRGEGCGAVVLRRAPEAGDDALALIVGSALSQDGRSNGLFAPRREAQVRAIEDALQLAGLERHQLAYVEAHGTGTRLGDAIELGALSDALLPRPDGPDLVVGAIKGNIGHLEAAAGIAGLIKTVLVLQHREAPPLWLPAGPNRAASTQGLLLPEQPTALSSLADGRLLAGVSSFGFGGTNVHAVLARATPPIRRTGATADPARVLLLSARDPEALARLAAAAARSLETGTRLSDLCRTLGTREGFAWRAAFTAHDGPSMARELARLAADPTLARRAPVPAAGACTAWQFPGQGAQRAGMAAGWYAFSGAFREALDHVCGLAQAHLDVPLLPLLLHDTDESKAALADTAIAQPALFCFEWSLAQALLALGLPRPDLMTGHSLGQYVAACLGDCFSVDDGVRLVVQRGRCFEALRGAGMLLIVRADACADGDELPARVAAAFPQAEVAVRNSPRQLVVACPAEHVPACRDALAAAGLDAQVFNDRYAFHSSLARDAAQRFADAIADVPFQPLTAPLLCDLGGGRIEPGTVLGADHWLRHAVSSVRFDDVHAWLAAAEVRWLMEVGPGAALTAMALDNGLAVGTNIALNARAAGAWDALLQAIAGLHLQGQSIDWDRFAAPFGWRRVPAPNYPFARTTAGTPAAAPASAAAPAAAPAPATGAGPIADVLASELAGLLRTQAAQVDRDANLLDLGVDSMVLLSAVQFIQSRWGVTLTVTDFFTSLGSVNRIAQHIAARAPAPASPTATTPAPEPAPARPLQDGQDLAPLMQAQIDALSRLVEGQLQVLRGLGLAAPAGSSAAAPGAAVPAAASAPSLIPFRADAPADTWTAEQAAYLQRFTADYTARTARSKDYARRHRSRLADNRMISGFRLGTKELVYPVVSNRAQGAHLWDLDGHRYLDLTMGFGVGLFGHNPGFVADAIGPALQRGYSLGPQSDVAGEVAELLCDITGHERAAFANTGSEAVMLAVRLARAATGRDGIVTFAGAYHGTADTVMARPGSADRQGSAEPFAPGITAHQVGDLAVLDYGSESSLEWIARHADRIAGVLVEPVQSRRPQLQPREYLVRLRELTARHGIALIFDEVLCGFRIHLRGGQGYFGVQADLASYGKIIGGGLPIGMVAGAARYLDHVDGGTWNYGDRSLPQVPMTFFAGTFCKHPLAMVAARAVLQRLKEDGTAIIGGVAAATAGFVGDMNRSLARHGAGFEVSHCGSLFRLPQERGIELLHYALLRQGLYIWEGRNCFLSTEHGPQDLALAATQFDRAVHQLTGLGLLGRATASSAASTPTTPVPALHEPTPEQEQLLALHELGDARWQAYGLSAAVAFSGPLDAARLEAAVDATVARHDALRARAVRVPGGLARVRIDADRGARLERQRVCDEPALQAALDQAVARPWDPYADAALRAVLFSVEGGGDTLLLHSHHWLVDGWSVGLVLDEILRRYAGQAVPQTAAPSFVQAGQRLQQQREGAGHAALRAHWSRWLAEAPARPAAPAPVAGAQQQVARIDAATVRALRQCARRRQFTLFQLLFAAYSLALHRVGGPARLVTAVPLARREPPQAPDVVGYLSSLCLVATTADAAADPWSHAQRCRDALIEGMRHGDFGYADLVELARAGGHVDAVLPDAVFNLERRPDLPVIDGLYMRWVTTAVPQVAFVQFANVIDEGEQLLVVLDHRPDVPGARLLAAFTDALALFSGTAASAPPWLDDVLRLARTQPQRLAVREGERETGYGALVGQALAVARRLRQQGLATQACVGVLMEPGSRQIAALLGTMLAGACYVPLDPAYPVQRVRDCIDDAQVRVLLVDGDATRAVVPDWDGQWIDVAALEPADPAHPQAVAGLPALHRQALAYVIHTSGSTGRPKGVAVTHGGLAGFLDDMRARWAVVPDDRFLGLTSVAFDIVALEIYLPLACGAACVVAPRAARADARALGTLATDAGVTVVQATPTTWRLLMAHGLRLPGLRIGGIGGEASGRAPFDYVRSMGAQAWNLYGPTEATIWASAWQADAGVQVWLGEPLNGVRWFVVDGEGRAIDEGTGELLLAGACLARGYLGRPGATAERFVPDAWSGLPGRAYRTGDQVRIDATGRIEYLNRIDAQVKIRGFRVELGDVESAAHGHPSVEQAACVVGAEGELDLHVQRRAAGPALDEQALRRHLAAVLPPQMVPTRIIFATGFPRTLNGKIDRKALARGPGGPVAPVAVAAPPAPPPAALADDLLALWREVLEQPALDRHADFFEAGGYSLRAARIIALARERLGVEIPYALFLEARTVDAIVQRLAPSQVGPVPAAQALPAPPPPASPSPAAKPAPAPVGSRGAILAASYLAAHPPAVLLTLAYTLLRRVAPERAARLRASAPRTMARWLLHAAGAEVSASGLDHLPRDGRRRVLLANHNSRFDAYVLLSVMPDAYKWFGSDEDHVHRERMSLLAWIDRRLDLTFTHYKQDPARTLAEFERAQDYLRAGGTVLLFPEGRFGPGCMGAVGDSCTDLALSTGADIVPVAITNSHALFEANGYRYAPAQVKVRFGKPIACGAAQAWRPSTLAGHVRDVLQRMLDQEAAGADRSKPLAQPGPSREAGT